MSSFHGASIERSEVMSESITPKQRKFIEGIANGLTHAESYRIAYSNSGKPATARREAARL